MAEEFGLTCIRAHRMDATKVLLKPATESPPEPGEVRVSVRLWPGFGVGLGGLCRQPSPSTVYLPYAAPASSHRLL